MRTITKLAPRRWTVQEFQRMGELGILPEGGVELIDGEVLEKNSLHSARRWSYEDVVRMVAGGVLDEDERIELIAGEIVCMSPIGHRHEYVVDLLTEYLGARVRGWGMLRVQGSIQFDWLDAPHPDLLVLRRVDDRYRARQADASDVLLVVEVADSSLASDLEKAALYASARIPEYWIADVRRWTVAVFRRPIGGRYSEVCEFRQGERFRSEVLGGEITVDEVLGPAGEWVGE